MKKNRAAKSMAKLRAKSLSPQRRKEIARKAIKARWDRVRKEKEGRG